jgi:hypothetical protein
MLLSSAICRAEKPSVTHNFHSDSADPAKLEFSNSYHTGTTPLLTYTCTGGAVFGLDAVSKSNTICMNLGASGNTVTTTAADSIAVIDIYHFPATSKCENIKIQLSRDSVHWTDYMDADYMNGQIWLRTIPGKYHIRITNTTSTKVSIREIRYSFDGCDCFLYIPED